MLNNLNFKLLKGIDAKVNFIHISVQYYTLYYYRYYYYDCFYIKYKSHILL